MPANLHRSSQERLTVADAIQTYLADWKAGRACDLESLLARIDPSDRPQAMRSLLTVDFRRRIEAGDRPSEKEYLQRFPNDMAAIAEVLEMFPPESRETVNLDAPIEITGYGSAFQAAADEFRAQVFGSEAITKSSDKNSTEQSFSPLEVATDRQSVQDQGSAPPVQGVDVAEQPPARSDESQRVDPDSAIEEDAMSLLELVVPVLYPLLGLGAGIVVAYLLWWILGSLTDTAVQ